MTLQFEKKDGVLPHDRIMSFVNREQFINRINKQT